MNLNILVLALVTLERLGELWLSNRNMRRLLAKGARECSPGHYPLIVVVHTAWLASLWWLAPYQPLSLPLMASYGLVEVARAWVLITLGSRWTTRIIIVPGETLVRQGPYRFLNHPNYVVVMAEVALLPLVFGLWRVTLLFTLLNAAVLAVRVGAENAALGR